MKNNHMELLNLSFNGRLKNYYKDDGTYHDYNVGDLLMVEDKRQSGARHFEQKRKDGRQQQGIDFFMKFVNADCPRIAIENPIGIMSSIYRKPDQIIQPWMFGDKFTKSTCLWLKGLPKLEPTNIVEKGEFIEWTCKKTGKKKRQAKWFFEALKNAKSSEERSIIRSKTFPGIAKAMAEQWTNEDRLNNLGDDDCE